MRKLSIIFITILSSLFIYSMLFSYSFGSVGEDQDISQLPFRKGERLTYEVRYKNVKTGRSILTFKGERELEGRKVYHIDFFTRLLAVTDIEELYAERKSFLPLEVYRTIKRFGTFTTRIKEQYNQKDFRVDIKKRSKLRSEEFSIKKDSKIHNAILLTYYYRAKPFFNKNEKVKINLPTAEFEVIYEGIRTLKTPLGEYQAHLFSSRPSKFKFWLSADDKKIPLKIENLSTLGYSLLIKSID